MQENFQQIIDEYYVPGIKKKLTVTIENCRENKYQRRPVKTEVASTPIPDYPGQILHMDILITNKSHFLTCIDKFSKFATTIPIASRNSLDVKTALLQIMNKFKNVKLVVSDNERSFQSNTIGTFLRDHFNAEQFFIPPMHSESNGQVERFHSTLLEIARCVKAQRHIDDILEVILLATLKYNNTVHSVTGMKPIDVINTVPQGITEDIKNKLKSAQQKTLRACNENVSPRTFQPGE